MPVPPPGGSQPEPRTLVARRAQRIAGRRFITLGLAATFLLLAFLGAVLMWLIDEKNFSSFGLAAWWALQTVTTVGYGDVTPKHASGRLVAVFVMLEGIAFLAIITAAITSSFVARAASERSLAEGADDAALEARLDARFDDLAVRFDRIESILREEEK